MICMAVGLPPAGLPVTFTAVPPSAAASSGLPPTCGPTSCPATASSCCQVRAHRRAGSEIWITDFLRRTARRLLRACQLLVAYNRPSSHIIKAKLAENICRHTFPASKIRRLTLKVILAVGACKVSLQHYWIVDYGAGRDALVATREVKMWLEWQTNARILYNPRLAHAGFCLDLAWQNVIINQVLLLSALPVSTSWQLCAYRCNDRCMRPRSKCAYNVVVVCFCSC